MMFSSFIVICLVPLVYMVSLPVEADQCVSTKYVYGENDAIDQILACSLSKTFDIDLTPQGEHIKNTPKTLVDQGLSNKTVIIAAKLSGLWSAKRADITHTGWRCSSNGTQLESIIEVTGLSLDVVERVDFPFQRNSNVVNQKPCKTFDLPLWLCRTTKPIYRTTKTWVNRAFFGLRLSQTKEDNKPSIESLKLLFTCPETFRQKITYSPSAMYVLKKQIDLLDSGKSKRKRRSKTQQDSATTTDSTTNSKTSVVHPISYINSQDGNSPATPPYHSFVNLIVKQSTDLLRSSLSNCIQILDSDLSLPAEHQSFSEQQFKLKKREANEVPEIAEKTDEVQLKGDCSDEKWLKNRIEIAIAASKLEDQVHGSGSNSTSQGKRSGLMLNYPVDPNQLLNPYGYYHENADLMVL